MRQHLSKVLFASLVLIVGFGALPASAAEPFAPETTPIVGMDAGWACSVSDDGRWVGGADEDEQEAGNYAAKLVDMQTGDVVSVPSDLWVTALELSDDGRFMTFAGARVPTGSFVNAHIYQYDRIAETTVQVTAEAHAIDNLRTSPSGDLVFWTERTISGGGGVGLERSMIWQRSSGQRADVTADDTGDHPPSPFGGTFRPWVTLNDSDSEYYLWQPLTGSELLITPPPNMATSDIVGVSLDGSRLAYSRGTGELNAHIVTVANRSGAISAEGVAEFGATNLGTTYTFADAGDRLLIQSAENDDEAGTSSHPRTLMWDINTNRITTLDIPNISGVSLLAVFAPGICAASSDLRWLVGSTHATETLDRETVRIDTQTVAPTPVDPSMLEGDQLGDQIQRLYQAYFLRSPDSSGLAYWRSQRVGGTALSAVSTEFSASPEFQQQYGSLDNAAFVDLIYQNVLDRVPDAEGRAHWIGVLDGGTSRGEVMLGFSESTEFINTTSTSTPIFDARIAQIDRLYRAHFGRAGDAGGLTYWFQRLKTGSSIADVATAFSTSPEFLATYGQLDDAAFVDLIYQNVLSRPADAEGRTHWIGILASGASRGVVMTNFSDSAEYILTTDSLPPGS